MDPVETKSPGPDADPVPPATERHAVKRMDWRRLRRRWPWLFLVLVIGAFIATGMDWTSRRKIPPSGGIYFFKRLELPVPQFRQADPEWHDDPLGATEGTLGEQGCAVASAAMVLKSYGVDTDPKRLNEYLTGHEGYVGNGWLVWEKAAELGGGHLEKAYEDLPSFWLIDWQLLHHNPVIVRLRFPQRGTTHFVVIAGKEGFDYLIRDPGGNWARGIYPLRDLTREIEALRYYRKL